MVLRTVILRHRAACAALLRYDDVLFPALAGDFEQVPQHIGFTVNGGYKAQPHVVPHPHKVDCRERRGGKYVHAGKGQAESQRFGTVIAGLILRQKYEMFPRLGRLQGFEV